MGAVSLQFWSRTILFTSIFLGCSSEVPGPSEDVDMGPVMAPTERQITPEQSCDRMDEDNDGLIDEGLSISVPCDSNLCGPGNTACNPGFGPNLICIPTAPNGAGRPEECNQTDDDCDGLIDEGLAPPGSVCGQMMPVRPTMGGANATNPNMPAGGAPSSNNPRMEVCDRQDNDGDGRVDEGLKNACGQCGPEPMEVCNGQDDDCDDKVDENVLNACGTCDAGEPEMCDGQDNDCDGTVDEGFDVNACGGCGDLPEEVCNGQDEDCDGNIDEGADCPCPLGTFMDKSYLFCRGDRKAWGSAQMTCQSVNYDLVVITSAEEDNFVYQRLEADNFGETWIGLSDRADEGTFVWVDGTSIDGYNHWDSGEPNDGGRSEDCAIIMREQANRRSEWDDRPCSTRYDFVCESK